MTFVDEDALLQGTGLFERAEATIDALTRRIIAATDAQSLAICLILTDGRPVDFSDGEYVYIHSVGVLIIRVNRHLELEERVRVFFRELAEFLQRCERGFCITKEVWDIYAPMEYNGVKEVLDVQAW
jgi:hypothetical protein